MSREATLLCGSPVPSLSATQSPAALPGGIALPEGLTHNRVAELSEGFRMLCPDGRAMSAAQLCEMMQSAGLHPEVSDAEDLLKTVDNSGGSTLTFTDFLVLMLHEVDGSSLEELKVAFRHCDRGGSGFVTSTQFCELFASMGEKSSPEEVEDLMNFADPWNSGKVDYHQFLVNLSSRYSND